VRNCLTLKAWGGQRNIPSDRRPSKLHTVKPPLAEQERRTGISMRATVKFPRISNLGSLCEQVRFPTICKETLADLVW
jgi:hypothetical protein